MAGDRPSNRNHIPAHNTSIALDSVRDYALAEATITGMSGKKQSLKIASKSSITGDVLKQPGLRFEPSPDFDSGSYEYRDHRDDCAPPSDDRLCGQFWQWFWSQSDDEREEIIARQPVDLAVLLRCWTKYLKNKGILNRAGAREPDSGRIQILSGGACDIVNVADQTRFRLSRTLLLIGALQPDTRTTLRIRGPSTIENSRVDLYPTAAMHGDTLPEYRR